MEHCNEATSLYGFILYLPALISSNTDFLPFCLPLLHFFNISHLLLPTCYILVSLLLEGTGHWDFEGWLYFGVLIQHCVDMQLKFCLSDLIRSSLVSRQHVGISIIHSVYQSCFSLEMKIKLKNFRRKSKLVIHLHALLINVLFVSREKIKWFLSCDLQYADAVLRHTTANAYQGYPEVFIVYVFLSVLTCSDM